MKSLRNLIEFEVKAIIKRNILSFKVGISKRQFAISVANWNMES